MVNWARRTLGHQANQCSRTNSLADWLPALPCFDYWLLIKPVRLLEIVSNILKEFDLWFSNFSSQAVVKTARGIDPGQKRQQQVVTVRLFGKRTKTAWLANPARLGNRPAGCTFDGAPTKIRSQVKVLLALSSRISG